MANPKKALEAMNTALGALEELDEAERQRAMTWLSDTLGTSVTPSGPPPASTSRGGGESGADSSTGGNAARTQTPKEFVASKQPTTDVERLTCLAYYLTKVRGTPEFNTSDLTDLNTEAAGRRFSNAAATGKNATTKSGYLTGASGKKRQITHLGEQVVEALPDRDAVKAILAAAPKPRKRSGRPKAKQAIDS